MKLTEREETPQLIITKQNKEKQVLFVHHLTSNILRTSLKINSDANPN